MRRAVPAVLLALCCVLAGCNAFAPGSATETSDGPAITPADVPDDAPDGAANDTANGSAFPPGLTSEGLTDELALRSAHVQALAGQSVTLDIRRREEVDGITRSEVRRTYRVGPNRTRQSTDIRFGEESGNTFDRQRRWSNATTRFERSVIGNTTTDERERIENRRPESYLTNQRNDLVSILESLQVDAVREVETTGGEQFYHVVGVVPQRGYRCSERGTVDATSEVDLLVDERGVVRTYQTTRVTCERTADGRQNATVVTDVSYADIGTTNASAPSWVADARDRIADREYVAPGVTTERIVDYGALQDAHHRIVANRSVTAETEYSHTVQNGTVVSAGIEVVRFDGDSETLAHDVDTLAENTTYTRWYNGTTGYLRANEDGNVTYHRNRGGTTGAARLAYFGSTGRYARETEVSPLDDGRHRVTARGLQTPNGDWDDADIPDRAGFVTFVVDERGYVSDIEARVVVKGYVDDQTVPMWLHFETRYSDLGTTTVDRPDWLDAARNATAADESPTDDTSSDESTEGDA